MFVTGYCSYYYGMKVTLYQMYAILNNPLPLYIAIALHELLAVCRTVIVQMHGCQKRAGVHG